VDTKDFLTHILPKEGVYCVGHFRPGVSGFIQTFHETIEEAAEKALRLDAKGCNTYYAISSFYDNTSRKAVNAQAVKTVCYDIDCGPLKPFPTFREGLAALVDLIHKHKLPEPMIVSSGNGLHVYWVLKNEVTREKWFPVARAMKDIVPLITPDMLDHIPEGAEEKTELVGKPIFDPAVPADASRVLRPIGTHNPKGNKLVRVLHPGKITSLSKLKKLVKDFVKPVYNKTTSTSQLVQNMQVQDNSPPADPQLVIDKCKQVKWAVTNQNSVDEPMWYTLMGVASYCEDPENTAIAWSNQHDEFDQEDTLEKMDQWKAATDGPATCAKFLSERPAGCAGCPHKDKISTPIQLGVAYEEVKLAADAPDITATQVPVPDGYKRIADGFKFNLDGVEIDVCNFDIYPVSYGRSADNGAEVARFHWKRKHVGWQELVIRQAHLTDGQTKEFTTTVADQGIVLATKKQTEFFAILLRNYMEKLKDMRTTTHAYDSMGWKEEGTQFLLGEMLYKQQTDGTVSKEPIVAPGLNTKHNNLGYKTAGNENTFHQITELVDRVNMPACIFAVGYSTASIMYDYFGLRGFTVSLFGRSGCGKSIAQKMAQAVWGSPTELHLSSDQTTNAMFSRVAMMNNLPLTIDEVSEVKGSVIGQWLYQISNGHDKLRSSQDGSLREVKHWATNALFSTNTSLNSKLTSYGEATEAQMMRLLEISIEKHPFFNKIENGERIHSALDNNYGHVGPKLITHILEIGRDEIIKQYKHHRDHVFRKQYGEFAGEERFWQQAVITQDFMNHKLVELGLVAYDPSKGTDFVMAQLDDIRKVISDKRMDAFEMLAEYMTEEAKRNITILHVGDFSPRAVREPLNGMTIRVDLYKKGPSDDAHKGSVLVDRAAFRKWLSDNGADYRGFLKELELEGALCTPTSGKASLYKDTGVSVPQQYVFGANLLHPRLQSILKNVDESVDDIQIGQLVSILD